VETLSTLQLRLPLRRRTLRRVVIAAVSACALILVAAGITRVVHASSEPERVVRAASAAPGPAIANGAATTPAQPAAATETAGAGGTATPGMTAQSAPMAGTLHLERNVTPRFVLLDGKKLSSRNEVVACGAHTIKVGHAKAHPIDVPCGGDVTVTR
jgi:hypothetical protein